MEFYNQVLTFVKNREAKIQSVVNNIAERNSKIENLKRSEQGLSRELNLEFDSNKIAGIKEINKSIEDLENEKDILLKNIENIKAVKMDYDLDALRSELTELLTSSTMKEKIETVLRLKIGYLASLNDLEAYAEKLKPLLAEVKYHLINTLDSKALEANGELSILRDYTGNIISVKINGMDIPYLPSELAITYNEQLDIQPLITRVDNIRRGV